MGTFSSTKTTTAGQFVHWPFTTFPANANAANMGKSQELFLELIYRFFHPLHCPSSPYNRNILYLSYGTQRQKETMPLANPGSCRGQKDRS